MFAGSTSARNMPRPAHLRRGSHARLLARAADNVQIVSADKTIKGYVAKYDTSMKSVLK
jgi:hypothetical protein